MPKYRATTVVLLDASGQQLLDLNSVWSTLGTASEVINTEVEILKSRRLLERVINVAVLIEDPEFNSALRPADFKGKLKAWRADKAGIQQVDSRISFNAVLPSFPSEPRKSLILAMSLILGGMLCCWKRPKGLSSGK